MVLPLTNEQLKAIRDTCPRTQSEIDQDLAILRHWLDKQHHLPKISDEMLKKIMFSLKYRMEKIKTVIDNFYTVKEIFPQIYTQQDPTTESYRKHVDAAYMFPLPKLTPELNRVLCYRMASTDARDLVLDEQLKRNEMMWSWLFDYDPLTLGDVWIFDLTHMDTMAHWAQFNVAFMKKLLKISLDAKPVRIKRVHFVNISSVAETTLNFVKHFFPQKFKDRLIFNSKTEGLYEYYPIDMLPNEWGGKAGSMESLNDDLHAEFIKRSDWFVEMEHVKADSSKRVSQKIGGDQTILGVEGNFKKLCVD
ncbi:alpha-tocopherol transfer protein-like [Adelges cooleyi]|uniref:alpha-tocopherol transfer protein-like n=1 Tax=Adelges cooleyi TaxID=133065 RepID=UPI00217FA3C7|nr:alpha-tocopherol transfer protein-like [Adelges cooleyi]